MTQLKNKLDRNVVNHKRYCCNDPKEKSAYTKMYEYYKYCDNCGKDLE